MKRMITLLLSLSLSLMLLTGCGEKSGVKKLLAAYEDSCRALSVEDMANCFNPDLVRPVTSLLGIFGVELSDLDSLLSGLVSFANEYSGSELEELYQTIKITPRDYTFNDAKDECDVTAEVSYTVDGEQRSDLCTFHCEVVDDNWYIFSME